MSPLQPCQAKADTGLPSPVSQPQDSPAGRRPAAPDLALGLNDVLPRLLQVNGREVACGVLFPATEIEVPSVGRVGLPLNSWVQGSWEVANARLVSTRPCPARPQFLICAAQALRAETLGGGEISRSRSSQGHMFAIKHLQYCRCQFFFSGDCLCVLRNSTHQVLLCFLPKAFQFWVFELCKTCDPNPNKCVWCKTCDPSQINVYGVR